MSGGALSEEKRVEKVLQVFFINLPNEKLKDVNFCCGCCPTRKYPYPSFTSLNFLVNGNIIFIKHKVRRICTIINGKHYVLIYGGEGESAIFSNVLSKYFSFFADSTKECKAFSMRANYFLQQLEDLSRKALTFYRLRDSLNEMPAKIPEHKDVPDFVVATMKKIVAIDAKNHREFLQKATIYVDELLKYLEDLVARSVLDLI